MVVIHGRDKDLAPSYNVACRELCIPPGPNCSTYFQRVAEIKRNFLVPASYPARTAYELISRDIENTSREYFSGIFGLVDRSREGGGRREGEIKSKIHRRRNYGRGISDQRVDGRRWRGWRKVERGAKQSSIRDGGYG